MYGRFNDNAVGSTAKPENDRREVDRLNNRRVDCQPFGYFIQRGTRCGTSRRIRHLWSGSVRHNPYRIGNNALLRERT